MKKLGIFVSLAAITAAGAYYVKQKNKPEVINEYRHIDKRPLPELKGVIGTNSWGSDLYEKALRGNSVSDDQIQMTIEKALDTNMAIFDTARDYGLGKCEPMIGQYCDENCFISCKYTPTGKYKAGQVHESFELDLKDLNRDYIDVYWLHLPNHIKENLDEMIDLYEQGKIGHIGVSNFNLEETIEAYEYLSAHGIKLYGVQNHYSLIARDWELNGLVDWCKDNDVVFWAWAVLEEGMLSLPKRQKGILDMIFAHKQRQLSSLYYAAREIGKKHEISIAQVAIAYVSSKGIIPIVGCRRPMRVDEFEEAINIQLTKEEIEHLENLADHLNVNILKADLFRFAVKK